MSYLDVSTGVVVANATEDERAGFYRRTYLHLAGAVAAYAVLVSFLLGLGWGDKIMSMLAVSKYSWLGVMVVFMGVSMLADSWARSGHSRELQYMGLSLYVVAFAVISLPILYVAQRYAPGVIQQAGMLTVGLTAGLTWVAFTTRKDFSFIGPAISIGCMVALVTIVASIFFDFNLGTFFSVVMMMLMAASILYTTSNIIHVYRPEQHVAASLSLFSSVGTLFWYAVQFFMSIAGGE